MESAIVMEHKIGEIITLPDGRKAEVVERMFGKYNCDDCIFAGVNCINAYCLGITKGCDYMIRTDHKNIFYREIKEK